jgi:hypothetical protein
MQSDLLMPALMKLEGSSLQGELRVRSVGLQFTCTMLIAIPSAAHPPNWPGQTK